MALKEYKKKRKFSETPEPAGEIKTDNAKPLCFVIQRHDASQLHFDLRLELDGVLKSWAVPKGPTLAPTEKRLAVMVEDHPLDYAGFEGVIPEGNYGAGSVMVWDTGVYHSAGRLDREGSEEEIRAGLEKGHISFVLSGKKLWGEFALVRLKRSKDPKAWLLIKADDEGANQKIVDEDRSAISGRTQEEIANEPAKLWSSKNLPSWFEKLPSLQMPDFIPPMLATLIKEPFDDEKWLFEVKWDGYRIITVKKGNEINLLTRNRKNYSAKFPSIVDELKKIPYDLILDGEVVVLNQSGKPQFELLQNLDDSSDPLVYYIFDLLYLQNRSLVALPLQDRRDLLELILPDGLRQVKLSESYEKSGRDFFAVVKKNGLEGMIAKKKDSVYEIGRRSANWRKIKTHLEQEAIIVGFLPPGSGRQYFASLMLAVYEEDRLKYVGNVGTGFSDRSLKELFEKMRPIIIDSLELENFPRIRGTFIEPKFVCEVKFQEWTKEGYLRQPVFLGLREDIEARDVHKEEPKG